jgi:sugar phosphate permease
MDSFDQFAGMRGWQWMFIIESIPAVILGSLVLFFLDNGIREAKWLTEEEKLVLERNIESDAGGKKKSPHSLGGVLKDHRVWTMSAIYFCFVMGQYGLTFWMPTLVKATGVKDNLTTGVLSAIPFLVAVVAMILCGRSADRHRERRWHLVIPAFCGAVGFVVAALTANNTAIAITFLSLAAAGVLTCAPLFWSLPTSFLRGSAAAAGIAAVDSIRESRRLCESLPYRFSEGCYAEQPHWDVHARGDARARCLAGAEDPSRGCEPLTSTA